MVTVQLTQQLADLLAVDAVTRIPAVDDVGAVVDALEAAAPGVRDRLVDAGRLRRFVLVFVDGEQADLATPVAEGSHVRFLGAVAGG